MKNDITSLGHLTSIYRTLIIYLSRNCIAHMQENFQIHIQYRVEFLINLRITTATTRWKTNLMFVVIGLIQCWKIYPWVFFILNYLINYFRANENIPLLFSALSNLCTIPVLALKQTKKNGISYKNSDLV